MVLDLWLSLIVGAIGYCIVWAGARMMSRRTLPQQHAEIREQVIALCLRWIEAEQERLYCEHELARLREAAPDDQAIWIVHSLEQVRAMPPIFVHLARRFGFKVPDHNHAAAESQQEEPTTAWGEIDV